MGLHLGGDITGMWWGGDVAAVHMGADLVWQAIITVTPEPPIFHDGDPWYTLPDMEGVTYTVDGTPAAGQTVTVIAVADDGYKLDGQTMWEHEYPSAYPVSGTWAASVANMEVVASHTIVEAGTYTIRHESRAVFAMSGIRGPWGTTTDESTQNVSVAEVTVTLTVGAMVEFLSGGAFRLDATGTWSIVKN